MAAPSAGRERAAIDINQAAIDWPCLPSLLRRLWKQYADVLSVEVGSERLEPSALGQASILLTPSRARRRTPSTSLLACLRLRASSPRLPRPTGMDCSKPRCVSWATRKIFIRTSPAKISKDVRCNGALRLHGCALRAIADEGAFHPARRPRRSYHRINSDNAFKIVRDHSGTLQRSGTVIIGMSAQHQNIQSLFAQVGALKGWKWTDQPTPTMVFSAQELGAPKGHVNVVSGQRG